MAKRRFVCKIVFEFLRNAIDKMCVIVNNESIGNLSTRFALVLSPPFSIMHLKNLKIVARQSLLFLLVI